MKKINLLYFSPTDTTKEVVHAVGETLGEIAVEYNITIPKSRKEAIEFSGCWCSCLCRKSSFHCNGLF